MPAATPAPGPASAPRRFTFDTVFDAGRVIAPPRPKTSYTAEEVEALRAAAHAEGQASAVARAEEAAADALAQARTDLAAALGALQGLAHEHRVASAQLAMACGRAIAGAALEHFPEAAAAAALEALAREIESQPRVVVRCAPAEAERLGKTLARAAEAIGYPGALSVRGEPDLAGATFVFDWGDGRAAFDPAAASARVAEALTTALAAEGLHAEPPPALERDA